jgi:uncharacterized protein
MKEILRNKRLSLFIKDNFVTSLGSMALGIFSTLIIGIIIKTIGEQFGLNNLVEIGSTAIGLMGAGIGVAVAHGLKAPPFVLFSSVFTGTIGATLGGPAGSLLAAWLATECGKIVSKKTKIDFIVTPSVTIFVGYIVAKLVGTPIQKFLIKFGKLIMWMTDQQPIIMGIFVALFMGLAITGPISSAALAIMLDFHGIVAGAATVGCCAQMIGFAVSSYRVNRFGGFVAIGIGTSKLLLPNVIKNPRIMIPPLLAGMIVAPFVTTMFPLLSNAAGAGMGNAGFVGPLMTFTTMGFTFTVTIKVIILYLVAPATISLLLSEWFIKIGWIQADDMKLQLEE